MDGKHRDRGADGVAQILYHLWLHSCIVLENSPFYRDTNDLYAFRISKRTCLLIFS